MAELLHLLTDNVIQACVDDNSRDLHTDFLGLRFLFKFTYSLYYSLPCQFTNPESPAEFKILEPAFYREYQDYVVISLTHIITEKHCSFYCLLMKEPTVSLQKNLHSKNDC
jgi:hypothetical protein